MQSATLTDEINLAFDQMDQVMARFRKRGFDILANEYWERWVELDDAYYSAVAENEDTDDIVYRLLILEENIIDAEEMMNTFLTF